MTKINPYNFYFPTGFFQFHKKQLFNFQLNRPFSWGYAEYDDLITVGSRIHDFNDWKTEITRLAEILLTFVSENLAIFIPWRVSSKETKFRNLFEFLYLPQL